MLMPLDKQNRIRLAVLILILALVLFTGSWISISLLYRTALNEEKSRLLEIVNSQAFVLENLPAELLSGPSLLKYIHRAYEEYYNAGYKSELTIGELREGNIVFLERQIRKGENEQLSIPFSSIIAEPMREALSGKSGIISGLDFRSNQVLAAFRPLKSMGWGLVAKIDIRDLQTPFMNAVKTAAAVSFLIFALGAISLFRTTIPFFERFIKSEENYLTLLQSVKDYAIYTLDSGGIVTSWNAGAENITGYKSSEIIGKHFSRFYTVEDKNKNKPEMDLYNAMVEGKLEDTGWRVRKDGSKFWANGVITAIFDKKESLVGYSKIIRDVTESMMAEKAVEDNRERFQALSEMVAEWSAELEINPGNDIRTKWRGGDFEKMTGYTSEEVNSINGLANIIYPDDLVIFNNSLEKVSRGDSFSVEYRIIKKSGEIRWIQVIGKPFKFSESGIPIRYLIAGSDVTEKKMIEEKLKTSINEKEALLRELYHRTKNNMQVISSLLQIYSLKADDEKIRRVFHEMVNRIQSMALVHQKLYQSKNLSNIDLSEYMTDLSNLLLASYSESMGRISIVFEMEKIPAQIDLAIPCGLLLNEIVTNSLKHAFPENRTGEIRIGLHKLDDNIIEMSVADNGVGVPPDFDFKNNMSMGMQSVYAICENQLHGEVSFESRGGVKCTLRFRKYYT
jgi:PAS domain S-box-containing protein